MLLRTFWSVFAEVLNKLPLRYFGLVLANLVTYFVAGDYFSRHTGMSPVAVGVMVCINPFLGLLWIWTGGGDVPAPLIAILFFLWPLLWAAGVEWALRRFVDRRKDSGST